jgi:hypothetical protein
VFHHPGDCNAPADPDNPIYDHWDVFADSQSIGGFTQLGVLHRQQGKSAKKNFHLGQYEMPYRLRLDALSCFEEP